MCLISLLLPRTARAYTCSATSPGTQNFGSVSPVSGSSYSTTGTLTVTCTVSLLDGLLSGSIIRACLSIAGETGSNPRNLTKGASNLQYNLYSDAAHTQIVGTAAAAPPNPIAVDFNLGLLGILLGGTSSMNVSLYGALPAGQTAAPAGSYSQSFTGATAVNYIAYTGAAPTCSAAWASGGSFDFSVSANVINDCNISAGNINFGSAGVLGGTLTASGSITAQCTSGDSYSIALNAGSGSGASFANRTMSGPGNGVLYHLYSNASDSTVWGDGTGGSSAVTGVGTGGNQNYTVYGVVPAQATPTPGAYSDTVTATVTY